MDDFTRRSNEMFTRVRDFGATRAADFPANTLGGELFATVAAGVEALDNFAATQFSGTRSAAQGTDRRGEARDDLREEMEFIALTARSMGVDTPGLEDKFRMPRVNSNDQDLLSAARAFARDAVQFRDQFIRYGMPADFIDSLNSRIEEFEQAISEQNLGLEARVSATAAIEETREQTTNAVRRLHAIVRNKYRNEAAALAAWETASHIERAPKAKPSPPKGQEPAQ